MFTPHSNNSASGRPPRSILETPYIPQPLVAPYLDEDGHCLFHSDLLPMDCTLVARLGCLGCIYSTRNLDPIELPEDPRYAAAPFDPAQISVQGLGVDDD